MKSTLFVVASLCIVIAGFGTASGQTMYWDINAATTGGSNSSSASGVWDSGAGPILGDYNLDGFVDAADYVLWRKNDINGPQGYIDWREHFGMTSGGATNWTSDSTGNSATTSWNSGDTAIFSAGTGVTGTSSITLSGAQTASGLVFEEGNVTISGGTSLTLSGAATVSVANAATISSVVGGTSGLSKLGAGTLTLSGNNTFTGTVTMAGGVIAFPGESSAAAGSANPLGAYQAAATPGSILVTASSTLRNTKVDTTGLASFVLPNRGITIGDGIDPDVLTADVADSGTSLKLSAVVAGPGRLAKAGPGTLNITNTNNTYTGGTTISGGKLVFSGESVATGGAANALGAAPGAATPGSIVLDNNGILSSTKSTTAAGISFVLPNRGVTVNAGGGTFDMAGVNTTLQYTGIIAGTGKLGVTASGGGGILKNLSNSNTWTGGVKIGTNATVELVSVSSAPNALGPFTAGTYIPDRVLLDGGTIRQTNTGNGASFLHSTADFPTTGIVSPDAGIMLTANGGFVEYTGAAGNVSVYNGTFLLASGVTSATLTKKGSGDFGYAGGPAASASSKANTAFTKLVVKEGNFKLRSAGDNTEVGFGAVPAAFTADAITLDGGGIGTAFNLTLNAKRGITVTSAGGKIDNGTSAITITMPAASKLTGTGKLTLGNASSSTSGGFILNATASDFSGALNVSGLFTMGTGVSLNVAELAGPASGLGRITVSSGQMLTFGSNNASTSYNGLIAGAGGFTKVGTGTFLMATEDYTNSGPTNIDAGTIQYGDANAGLSSTSLVTIAPFATLDMNNANDGIGALAGGGSVINNNGATGLTLSGSQSATFSGTIGGNSNLTINKTGGGVQTLSGANNFGGTTTITAGTLELTGAAASLGFGDVTVSAGGILSLQSDVANGIYDFAALKLAGSAPTGGYINLGMNETVNLLFLGGVGMPDGEYGSTASGAAIPMDQFFAGIGKLSVSSSAVGLGSGLGGSNVPEPTTTLLFLMGIASLIGGRRGKR